jgi:hypothetical protein
MATLELSHWLMIAGTFLVVAGFIGVLISVKKAGEIAAPSDARSDTARHQMRSLPKLRESKLNGPAVSGASKADPSPPAER